MPHRSLTTARHGSPPLRPSRRQAEAVTLLLWIGLAIGTPGCPTETVELLPAADAAGAADASLPDAHGAGEPRPGDRAPELDAPPRPKEAAAPSCVAQPPCSEGVSCGGSCCGQGEWCDPAQICRCGQNSGCAGGDHCAAEGPASQSQCGSICCGFSTPCPL